MKVEETGDVRVWGLINGTPTLDNTGSETADRMKKRVDEFNNQQIRMHELNLKLAEKSALDTQIGGGHYKKKGLQPFEMTFANYGYDGIQAAVYTKINKYLLREKGTHREDINKAIHCLQIQLEFLDKHEAAQAINQPGE
jgi:hypothetical protein